MAQAAHLFRSRGGKLVATQLGKDLLGNDRQCALQAILFHVAFWHANLAYFGRGLLGSWPQSDVGVVLWSLSAAASEWQSRERLTRFCTIPINGVLESTWDVGSSAMEARILRPLLWFGLLEHRNEEPSAAEFGNRYSYRKAPLFDRFVTFDVRIEGPSFLRH